MTRSYVKGKVMRFTEEMFRAHREQPLPGDAYRFEHGLPLPARGYDFGFDYKMPHELFGDDWSDRSNAPEGMKIVVLLAFTRSLPELRFDREWLAIYHQCGGHMSNYVSMIATRLRPRALVGDALLRIARDRYGEDDGWFSQDGVRASQIVSYSAALAAVGLDCDVTWRFLQQGTYPIDATQQNLDRLAEDAPDLRAIADWRGRAPNRYSRDPVILVLCDDSG